MSLLLCCKNIDWQFITVVFNLGLQPPEGSLTIFGVATNRHLHSYYICFIRVLDGGRWVMVGRWGPLGHGGLLLAIMGRGTKTVENHWFVPLPQSNSELKNLISN